jgi:flagellin
MRINQNIMAFNSYRNLSATNSQLGKSLEKLSSGFRINRAADDAAGLVVSEGLRSQVSGLQVASRNAQDGTSVVQTAEGALTEVHSMLRRMRDLTLQASNTGANDADARAAAQAEIDQLTSEINRVASDTKFGQVALLDGNYGVTNAAVTGTAGLAAVTTGSGAGAAGTFTLNMDSTNFTVSLADATFTAGTDAPADLAETLQNAIRGELSAQGRTDLASEFTVEVKLNDAGTRYVTTFSAGGGESFTVTDGTNTPLADLGIANGTYNATGSGGLFQVGANAGETISVAIGAMDATTLGVNALDVETDDASRQAALNALDTAISSVSTQRGDLGAIQNRFEHTIANLSVTAENLAASESRIRDTDMALELVSFTRHQILQQAGTSMLAQANQVPQSVLSLLR